MFLIFIKYVTKLGRLVAAVIGGDTDGQIAKNNCYQRRRRSLH